VGGDRDTETLIDLPRPGPDSRLGVPDQPTASAGPEGGGGGAPEPTERLRRDGPMSGHCRPRRVCHRHVRRIRPGWATVASHGTPTTSRNRWIRWTNEVP